MKKLIYIRIQEKIILHTYVIICKNGVTLPHLISIIVFRLICNSAKLMILNSVYIMQSIIE